MEQNILKNLNYYFDGVKIEEIEPEFVPYSFPDFPQNLQTLQAKLGRKWAVNLENLYLLSLCIYNRNLPSYVTSISTKGIAKKCRFNSYQSASNLIELAKKINLIQPAFEVGKSIESYCTGGTGLKPYAKRYYINTKLAKFIIQEYEKICVQKRKNPKLKRKKNEAIPNAYIFPKRAEKAILKSVKNKDFAAIQKVKFGANKGIAGFT
ncbi:MAG: hypothetical protein MR890_03870 [Akkermansia muciniphila]|nr:hypothetical protein [Akkermansia muciniphila]